MNEVKTKNNLTFKLIIDQMTLEEKASLMSGDNFWNTKSIDRLGIPSIMLTDGPHGLRKQGGKADHLGLNKSIPATCFPTAATLANSWDETLLTEVGQCLGKEAEAQDVQVLLGPGLNIKRNPLCGRNFEYFSEDPYLTGKLAAAMTRGIQSEGISACPKHFAVNSQETHRMIVDEIVDERALHELYLEGFRYVVKEAKPKTIMTSYNKVNGTYANENMHLLQDILVKDWGYDGVLVTDWGGNNDRVSGLLAGNTLEMPSTNGITDAEIVQAVKNGQIPEALVDQHVDKLLTLIASTDTKGRFCKKVPHRDTKADSGQNHFSINGSMSKSDIDDLYKTHHEKAIEAASRSIVLLKNDMALLPLTDSDKKVAIIGDFAENPRYQGAGSSLIVPTHLDNLSEALKKTDLNIIGYEKGFRRYGQNSPKLLREASRLAQKADIVLLFLGLDEGSEAEGVDRKHMRLSENQLTLVEEIARVNNHIVLILAGGAPIEINFEDKVQAIVHGYLPGQGGGRALAKILVGEYNPSGKLAETYPLSYKDVASSAYYPGEQLTSEHRESIFIGYRHYDTAKMAVRYPFGHGLSYTTYEYGQLRVDGNKVTLSVTNTGAREGEEIVQIYVAPASGEIFREVKALKAFAKVALLPGETKEVSIELDEHAFTFYHITEKRWVTETGDYLVMAGASSRDIRLSNKVHIVGETLGNPYNQEMIYPYMKCELNSLTSKDFEALFGDALPESLWSTRKKLEQQDLIEQARYGGWFGRLLFWTISLVHHVLRWIGKPIASNNVLFVMGMPLRSVARMSGGRVDMKMLEGILMMLNGKFLRGLGHVAKAWMIKDKKAKTT